jgi:UDP-N-acetylmuramate--alanine ligase
MICFFDEKNIIIVIITFMKKSKKVFLVGIGGIGVSALAKYLHKNGYEIFGSSDEINENIEYLQNSFGLNFLGNHSEDNLSADFDFLIYSPAVNENNLERQKAKKLGIKEYSYPEFLGKVSKNKFTISVSGTNGKTTTTTMIAEILENFKKDATAIIGGISKKFNSNFLHGDSENFLVESCEYMGSFLSLSPDIIVITNITPDHMDYFGNFDNYKKVFTNFLDKYKGETRILICDKKNKNLNDIVERAELLGVKIVDYKKYEIQNITIPGDYNRENAQVALAVSDFLEINLDSVREYLSKNLQGTKRRFEFIGKNKNGAEVYDDYAHNPEGLKVLRSGFNEKFLNKKKVLIFQPHLFSRTQDFFLDFVEEISEYDEVYMLPIYRAREKKENFKVSSESLFEKVLEKNKKTFLCKDFDECVKKINEKKYNKDFILITVGAGDVYKISRNLIS